NPGEIKDLGTISLVQATKIIKGKVTKEDGSAVTDAEIGAFSKETQRWVGTSVDGLGNYSLAVLGGSWEVSIHPISSSPDWNYSEPPRVVSFVTDNSSEEKIVDFVVPITNAVVTGKVLRPDGATPVMDTVFVGLRKSDGAEFGGPIDSTGSFYVSLTDGVYNVFIHSEDPYLTAPTIPSVTVGVGETVDIGTITLIKKEEYINGMVIDEQGNGIGGVEIHAWMPEGQSYAMTETDPDGSYELFVTPGEWEVSVSPDPSMNLYSPEPHRRLTVEAGVAAVVDFTLYVAEAGISGTVVDKDDNILTNLYGFAGLEKTVQFGPGIGGEIDRGKFFFKAPAGTYLLSVFLPPDSPYTTAEPQTVTLVSGETINVKVVVLKNNSKITGFLKDEAGNIITGVDAHIFASSRTGVWQEALFDKMTGEYTLRVAAGTWYVGYDIDSTTGFMSRHEAKLGIIVGEGETIVKDLIVQKADARITGQVTDASGKGVPYVFVGVSKASFVEREETEEFKDPIVAGSDTGPNGFYSIAVPAGSYFVKTFTPPEKGFINSEEKSITITEGESMTLNLQLKKSDLRIIGKVFLGEDLVSDVFVSAWSEKGGYQESFSYIDGSFQLNVTSFDTWVVAAYYEMDGIFYKSNEISVEVSDSDVFHDIYLKKFDELPDAVTKTTEADQPSVVEVKEGPTVVAPAGAV
ncbi:MAG: carboxypeptidase-like regulatory domain-containing protein, partial [Candidatus Ranarchaeia archaeon]